MTVPFATPVLDIRARRSYQILGTSYRFVVTKPELDTDLWSKFLTGAHIAYARHGIEEALDPARDDRATTLFLAAVDQEGNVVGGVRVQGPYNYADEAHALAEWHGQAGEQTLRKQISDRIPFGVLEMKTAWVGRRGTEGQGIADAIARAAYPVSGVLGAQFVLATASDYVLGRWTSSGAQVATEIPAAPYPTPESGAKVIWWNRQTFPRFAHPKMVPAMFREADDLSTQTGATEDPRLTSAQ